MVRKPKSWVGPKNRSFSTRGVVFHGFRLSFGYSSGLRGCLGGGDRVLWGWDTLPLRQGICTPRAGHRHPSRWCLGAFGVVSGTPVGGLSMPWGWSSEPSRVVSRCPEGGERWPLGSQEPPQRLRRTTSEASAWVPGGYQGGVLMTTLPLRMVVLLGLVCEMLGSWARLKWPWP